MPQHFTSAAVQEHHCHHTLHACSASANHLVVWSDTALQVRKQEALSVELKTNLECWVHALQVCKQEEIPVKLEAPRLEDFEHWEGAAVASTSRLFLPIDELSAPILGQPTRSFQNSEHSLIKQIDQLVQAELEHHSEPL